LGDESLQRRAGDLLGTIEGPGGPRGAEHAGVEPALDGSPGEEVDARSVELRALDPVRMKRVRPLPLASISSCTTSRSAGTRCTSSMTTTECRG
jgi:hypothetical protein